jgi:hypothetical protein
MTPPPRTGASNPACSAASRQDQTRRCFAMLPAVLRRAYRLGAYGENDAALRLLAYALAGIDPITAPPDPGLIDAATLYAALLADPCDVPRRHDLRLTWSRYAYQASERGFGTHSDRWQHAADGYAAVLSDQNLTSDAVAVHQRRLTACQQHQQHSEIPFARGQLATALHADGRCVDAREQIRVALHAWRHTAGVSAESGQALLRAHLRILAGCGRAYQAYLVAGENTDLFGAPGSSTRQAAICYAAMNLRKAELEHPPICELRSDRSTAPQVRTDEESLAYWCALLSGEARNVPPSPASGDAS